MKRLNVGTTTMHKPSKPTKFILLRGLARDHRHWGDFIPLLKNRFPNIEIVTPDIPGNGQHYQQTTPTTISEITDIIRSEVAISATLPAHFIALSMGAMIAIDWMTRYSNECAAAVLMNTSLKGINPIYHRMQASALPKVITSILEPNITRRERHILSLTSSKHQDDNELIERWREYAIHYPVSRKNAIRQLIAAMRFYPPQQRPPQSMLFLNGKQDKLVSPRCSQTIAKQWDATFKQHPEAGHDLPLDSPEWVCQEIFSWIN